MDRTPRSLLAVGIVAFVLGGCSRPASVSVSASLGAEPLPLIEPPTQVLGPLNGEVIPRSRALHRPLAVIVDNLAPNARPQTGLSQASMIFETLVEGGITRLMAVYLEQDAPKVGPLRSSRLYFDRWAAAFHAILVHVGGNDDAQDLLWRLPSVFNVDEGPWETPSAPPGPNPFWRTADRAKPYNAYGNLVQVREYAQRQHQDWAYTQASFPHKHPAPMSRRGRSGSLSLFFVDPLSSSLAPDPDYTVQYQFDRRTDTYLRLVGGAPQIDAANRQPLRAANIVVMLTGPAVADAAAGYTVDSILIPTLGAGTAWYFLDGKVVSGSWQQKDQFAPLRFLDRHGNQVALNPGQTWVEVAPKGSSATWSFH